MMPTYAKRDSVPKKRPAPSPAPADTTEPMLLLRSKKKIKQPSKAEIEDMQRQEFIRKNRFTVA